MAEFSFKDTLGIVADLMAVFGVGGFFTWAYIRKSVAGVGMADAGVTIFAYSVKLFLSLTFLAALALPVYFSQFGVVLVSSGSYVEGDGLWNPQKPIAYALSYFVTALWSIPFSILCVSSIFVWSLEPFRRFVRAFTGKDA